MKCPTCQKPCDETCPDGLCRACHVSCSWEDCVDGTFNARTMLEGGTRTREQLLELYPKARI